MLLLVSDTENKLAAKEVEPRRIQHSDLERHHVVPDEEICYDPSVTHVRKSRAIFCNKAALGLIGLVMIGEARLLRTESKNVSLG